MGNLVIVAIPEEQDRVWKISSEKVPHLTLLFLGDADSNPNVQQIMEFVQHAVDVSEHGRFYLDVDRRDVLGSDEADVVFFSKRSWNLKWIKQFRSQLLQNDAIRTAYDSTEQFPEWQPHLTLGYPTAPAKEDPEDHPLYSVCFDRIAVWTGDFDGPEFRLEWPDREFDSELAVAYSAVGKSVIAELLHVSEKPWSDYTKADYSLEQWHTACLIHTHDGAPTSKSECKLPVKTPDGTLNRGGVHAAAAALAGARGGVTASDDQKAKAAKALVRYYAQLDEEPPESLVQHSGLTPAELAIMHVGVKGMRWGQRKTETKTETVTINGKSKMVTPKKAAKLDKSWEKNQFTLPKGIERHNAMAEHFNGRIGALNDKHQNDDFSKEAFDSPAHWSPKYKEYMNGVAKLEEASFRHAVTQVHGSSPTGKKKMTVEYTSDGDLRMVVKNVDAAHAAIDPGDEIFLFKVTRNSNGLITAVEPSDNLTIANEMAQTESFVDDYLAHYGVKGMHWGVRKSQEVTPTSVQVKTTPHNRKTTKVEAKGGAGHDAHPDAIKVAEARQKMRKSGTAALSNAELKEVARRLQLESDVSRLEGERKSGSTFVGKLLRKHGSQQLDRGISRTAGQVTDEAATRVGRAATKKIFKAGVAAAL